MTAPNELIEQARQMALTAFPNDTDAFSRGLRLMDLLLSNPWGAYSKLIADEITAVIGRFGHLKPEIIVAGGGTSLASWPGPCGDLLHPAAFIRINIIGELQKPQSVTFCAVVKGHVFDCYASHRYLHMDVKAENYRIYATT